MLEHLNTALAAIGTLATLAQLALDVRRARTDAGKDDQER